MYLERLEVEGFRNCPAEVSFDPSLTILIGENNSGKSNVVDALRSLLQHEFGNRRGLRRGDFQHDGTGASIKPDISITATFAGLNIQEKGRMAMAIAPEKAGPGKARLGLRASLGEGEHVDPVLVGGDLDNPEIETRAFSVAQYTYLPPLRDAEADLLPGQTNRLARLLSVLTPDATDRDRLEGLAQAANKTLEADKIIKDATALVQDILDEMTGTGHRQRTNIALAEARFESLIRNLLSQLGEKVAWELVESGLGYQNILYMAVLLAHLSELETVPLRVLLVEEPEAHLHPQLQDLLLRYLQNNAIPGRQVIVTSNSPQFAAAAELNRLVVLVRPGRVIPSKARGIAQIAMEEADRAHVRRFLDVTKAALFFARAVILVEGVSEQLLLPRLARIMNRQLADSGVSVINVGGVAFRQFAELFGEGGLPIPCAIVSDGDPPKDDPERKPGARARRIAELAGGNVGVFLSDVTLEWDLARAASGDNRLITALAAVHPQKAAELRDMDSSDRDAWASAFQARVGRAKAEVAQNLAGQLESSEGVITVPGYLRDAISHVTEEAEDSYEGEGADDEDDA